MELFVMAINGAMRDLSRQTDDELMNEAIYEA